MSLLASLKRSGPSGFGYGSTAEDVTAGLDLAEKTFLVTGCNAGIGFETLRVLGLRGAHVLAAARTAGKARDALERAGVRGTALACDLSEPGSVRDCVAAVHSLGRRLDGIVANAGIMAPTKLTQKHGLEIQFLTNHVGHFTLVTGILDALADDGRVVVVSSRAHLRAPPSGIEFDNLSGERSYSPFRAYGQSKLANLLFALALSRRLPLSGQTANAIHPGVIRTELQRHMGPTARGALAALEALLLKTVPQGAATQCYAATHPGLAGISGRYLVDCNIARPAPMALDQELQERLWVETGQLVERLDRFA